MSTSTLKVVTGDISIDEATGRPIEISGTEKFKQDVREVLDRDTDLNSLIGTIDEVFSLRIEINRRLQTAFALFKAQQDVIQRFDRGDEERFASIVGVQVLPLRDPTSGEFSNTTLAYRLDVLSVKGLTTTVTGQLIR